jgi:hypothetical protein
MQNTKRLIKSSETARSSRQEIDLEVLEGDSGRKEMRRVSLRNYRTRLSKSNGFATISKLTERIKHEEIIKSYENSFLMVFILRYRKDMRQSKTKKTSKLQFEEIGLEELCEIKNVQK